MGSQLHDSDEKLEKYSVVNQGACMRAVLKSMPRGVVTPKKVLSFLSRLGLMAGLNRETRLPAAGEERSRVGAYHPESVLVVGYFGGSVVVLFLITCLRFLY